MFPFVTIISFLGALLVLIAYALLSLGKVSAKSAAYQWMNVLGVVGISMEVLTTQAWGALFLNVVWGVIGIWALVSIARGKSEQ